MEQFSHQIEFEGHEDLVEIGPESIAKDAKRRLKQERDEEEERVAQERRDARALVECKRKDPVRRLHTWQVYALRAFFVLAIVAFLPLIVYLAVPSDDSIQSNVYIVQDLLESEPPSSLPQQLRDRFNTSVLPLRYYIGHQTLMDFRRNDQAFDDSLRYVTNRRVRDPKTDKEYMYTGQANITYYRDAEKIDSASRY